MVYACVSQLICIQKHGTCMEIGCIHGRLSHHYIGIGRYSWNHQLLNCIVFKKQDPFWIIRKNHRQQELASATKQDGSGISKPLPWRSEDNSTTKCFNILAKHIVNYDLLTSMEQHMKINYKLAVVVHIFSIALFFIRGDGTLWNAPCMLFT